MVLGRLVRIAPGHYKVVFDEPEQVNHRGGRKPGSQKPVPKRLQQKGKKYCTKCNRPLNKNNRTGLCRGCAPRGKELEELLRG